MYIHTYTCINTYNVLARVIWPATFARSAGPPGGGRTYNINKYIYIDGGAPVVRLGGLAPARPITCIHMYTYVYTWSKLASLL